MSTLVITLHDASASTIKEIIGLGSISGTAKLNKYKWADKFTFDFIDINAINAPDEVLKAIRKFGINPLLTFNNVTVESERITTTVKVNNSNDPSVSSMRAIIVLAKRTSPIVGVTDDSAVTINTKSYQMYGELTFENRPFNVIYLGHAS
jgi:hypothetical protein